MAPRLSTVICVLACAAARALAQSAARGAGLSASRANAAASGGVCRVSSGADSGAGSLRAALADPGCTSVVIAAGTTIVLESQLDVTTSVVISCDVATAPFDIWSSISGGGGGASPLKCVLDGAGRTRIMYVEVTSPDLRLTLRGLVLRNGAALVNLDLGDTAGAIYFRPPGGVLTVEACAFESNRALFLGGAIRTKNTADLPLAIITLIVRDSTFDQNSAAFGGAISTGTRTTFTVERSVFTRNLAVANADTGGFSSGGAISSGGTQLRMSGTTLDANVAGLGSGALDLFSTCPFDFGPDEPFQQTTTAEISASVFKANSAGADASADLIGLGGAVGVFGCNYAEPAQGVAVPRTMLRLSESAFEANVAVGADSYGGAVATGYGVSTLVLSTAFVADRDACSPNGALYINAFSSEGNGCSDTLSVQAEVTPACDAWTPLGLVHEEAGSLADDTRQPCVPLEPSKTGAFCCAPSLAAPALVCPLAPDVPTDLTCAGTTPRQASATAKADVMTRMLTMKMGDAMA